METLIDILTMVVIIAASIQIGKWSDKFQEHTGQK